MFKLLDNKWRNLIISELQDHIGKTQNSKEITNRNIYQGTEIEFLWIDEFEEEKLITGVVMETDYESSVFKVDSYENIYEVELEKITKILNNTKFKYNLNKLNNIDFL
jgi:phosphopentomutase